MPLDLFKKAQKPPTVETGISNMKSMIETLEKRDAYLEVKIKHEEDEVRRFLGLKNKKAAIISLKKKKMYESQMERNAAASMTLHTQVMAIENQKIVFDTTNAMRQGADIMIEMNKKVGADQVYDVMDKISEQLELVDEIDNAMKQSIGPVYDDDELEAELAMLEEDSTNEMFGTVPKVSTQSISQKQKQKQKEQEQEENDEEEFRALEAALAM